MQQNLDTTIIETNRLLLVPVYKGNYLQDIFIEFTPEITHYMFPKSPEKIEDTQAFLDVSKEEALHGISLTMAITDKDSHAFIGVCGIHNLHSPTPELGIWIKKSAHGNAYGKEAVTGIKKWVDQHYTYEYIAYPVDRKNIGSRKIAESLGGIVKKEYLKTNASGNILDEVEYWIYKTV